MRWSRYLIKAVEERVVSVDDLWERAGNGGIAPG